VNKRRRIALMVLLLAVLSLAAWFTFHSREPAYQGKPLSFWLDELTAQQNPRELEDSPPGALEKRHLRAETALRQIGTNALPYLLALIRNRPKPSPLRDKIEEFLEKNQSVVRIRLPEQKDGSWQACEAFFVLGDVAKPAIPELEKLLMSEHTAQAASECLRVFGVAAVPALLRGLANTNPQVQGQSLMTLGEIGPAARDAIPPVLQIAQAPGARLAGQALRLLSELETNGARFLPLFTERLNDTNSTFDAAFALGRSGPEGVTVLVESLTNQDRKIRSGILAALDPHFRSIGRRGATPYRDYIFSRASVIYNSMVLRFSFTLYPPYVFRPDGPEHGDESAQAAAAQRRRFMVAAMLTSVLDHPNASTRLTIVERLAEYGAFGAPGLSIAARDENEYVRKAALAQLGKIETEWRLGAAIRGPKNHKQLALVFTGHSFAEGGEMILNELARHNAKGSFFFTGDFLTNSNFAPLVQRIVKAGHYLGPHSDKHLLYCSWDETNKTLVDRAEFRADLGANLQKIQGLGVNWAETRYFLPPYEHYNRDISQWTLEMGLTLINFTPGTRSNADYTGEADKNFVSSQKIFNSIVARERDAPNGLNGFILLLHIGAGPGRVDKFHARFGELLDYLKGNGYELVRVDELLRPPRDPSFTNAIPLSFRSNR
jgi:peptidoglycan/xylan/chitin deacetylase (PgdA/CDA1 family)